MNILLGTSYPYRNQRICSGVEVVSKNLKLGFDKYGLNLKVQVVSGSTNAQKIYETNDGITYIKKPRLKIGSVFVSQYPIRIKKLLRKNDFDVLNAHEIEFAYYGLEMKDKLVFTLHGFNWEEEKYIARYKQPLWRLFYVNRLYKTLKELKYFISINPFGRKLIENKTNATIFDICNPITDEFFDVTDDPVEKRMLYIGNISKMKNLFSLVKALHLVKHKIKDFKLIIAGKIEDKKYFDQIITYIKKQELSDNINYLGLIEGEQKLKEFSKMSFLVLPSFNEHAPMVISEAFATGRPVIASNVGGIPYMVEDNKNGFLIDPKNIRDIADKIMYFLENPHIARFMGINAKKYAKKHHSLKTVIQKYRAVYEEIDMEC